MKKYGVFFYLLIALVVGIIAFLTIRLAPNAAIDTPPVVLATPAATEAAQGGESSAQGSQAVSVTPETVQAAIASLDRADSYSRVLTVETFWTGGSSSQVIQVWVQGENSKLAIDTGSGSVKYVLIRDGERWVWYSDSTEVHHGMAGEDDADAFQTLFSYEEVMLLDPADILEAGYTDYNGEGCIFVRYASGQLGYEQLYYVSEDSGLPVSWETYDGGTLVYRMSSSSADLSTPDDEVFAAP